MMKSTVRNLLALGVSLNVAGIAHAQTTAAPAAAPLAGRSDAEPTSDRTLQDIIVTAQKRESKLETTPMTLNVISGDALAAKGTREIKDLSATVPGLAVNEAPGGFTGVSIRGIGTTAASQLFEQSVGLFVDGVYNPRARQFRNAIFDVERVEVIKGSQGVLFGKNTSVGAISVVSKRPGDVFGGYLAGGYETAFGSWSAEGAVDVPVTDRVAVRVAGFYSDEEGYVRNVTLNRDEQQEDRYLIRGTIDWKITDTLSASLKLQAARSRGIGSIFKFLDTTSPATLLALGVADAGQSRFTKYENSQPLGEQFDRQRSFDPSLNLNLDLGGGYSLTSVTGYQNYDYSYGFDSDSTPVPIVYNFFDEKFDQFTQELRLTSPSGRPVEFIVGAFYQNQHVDFDYQLRFLNFAIAPGVQLTGIANQNFRQTENAYAGFGQITWHIAPALRLDVGGRLSQDDKTGTYVKTIPTTYNDPTSALPFVSPVATTSGRISDLTFDASGTLSYNITPRSVLYASVGRGTKGGAFNNTGLLVSPLPNPLIVPKEVATTYEAGIKGRFFGGRVYASLAVFHLDIKNFQDSYYSSAARGFLIRSLDAQSTGVEGEAQAQLSRWLNLYGNFSYAPTAKLATGERTQRSPEFTGVIGTRVATDIGSDFKLSGNAQLVHSSNYYNQPPGAPGNNLSGSYDLVSARIALTYVPAKIEFSISGENLTDDFYKPFSFGSPLGIGTIGAYNRPRTIRLGARISF